MSDEKYRMRICIWYNFKQGKSAAESHRTLCAVFGENALSETQCREWFRRFQSGDESIEDHEHGRRPQIIDNDELKAAIESDSCQTTRDLAERFDCSHVTIANHLHAIGMSNQSGKWVHNAVRK